VGVGNDSDISKKNKTIQIMLTLVDSTELNLSVLPSRFIVCQLKSEDGNTRVSSCVGATSANKVKQLIYICLIV